MKALTSSPLVLVIHGGGWRGGRSRGGRCRFRRLVSGTQLLRKLEINWEGFDEADLRPVSPLEQFGFVAFLDNRQDGRDVAGPLADDRPRFHGQVFFYLLQTGVAGVGIFPLRPKPASGRQVFPLGGLGYRGDLLRFGCHPRRFRGAGFQV